jgi:TonB family protein
VRREPVVGEGDSNKTMRPRPSEPTPRAELAGAADEEKTLPSTRGESSEDHGADRAAGRGPLDATAGAKSFDAEAIGRAADTQVTRAASNDSHPGRADFTAVATPGPRDGLTGRGIATQPGVTASPSGGTQPSLAGAPQVDVQGAITDLDSVERVYSRELLEIRKRIAHVGIFPKRLALALEQGEAIVQFTVDAAGRVVGEVTLLKSAGFAEFDEEAVARVRRAAPFPGMKRTLPVRLRVSFHNPLIR